VRRHIGRRNHPQADQEVDFGQVGADMGQELGGALDGQRLVAGAYQRRGKPVTYERGVVGDDDGLVAHGLIAEFIRFLLISELLSIVILRSVYGHLSGM